MAGENDAKRAKRTGEEDTALSDFLQWCSEKSIQISPKVRRGRRDRSLSVMAHLHHLSGCISSAPVAGEKMDKEERGRKEGKE